MNKVFVFLNQTPTGTDEAVLLLDLRKAYLSFVIQLFNLDLESVFVSDRKCLKYLIFVLNRGCRIGFNVFYIKTVFPLYFLY